MQKPIAIHYGAGNIGRGFIGPLLAKSYHVIFVDVQEQVIDAINQEHTYDVHILDGGENHTQPVSDISAVLSTKPDMPHVLLDATIVTTSVGPDVLKRIAPSIAKGIKERAKAHKSYLNVIACENLKGATSRLESEVTKALEDDQTTLQYLRDNVGFANCTVDRIVPPFDSENVLDVAVEGFYEWIVDKNALKGPIPKIEGMTLSDDLEAYVERKLFTLNTGHAMLAFMGILKGYHTIDESVADDQLREIVLAGMRESGAALVKKYHFDAEEHEEYVQKILKRFENSDLKDDLLRVSRAPLRKLGRDDRLVGPTNMAREFGLERGNLLKGVAAAFLHEDPDDEECVKLRKIIEEKGIEKAVREITGIEEGSEDLKTILREYRELQSWKR